MMNINILNKVVKGVSDQIPLINSFYTQSPYESWNVKEVKYGSVSFVVTKTTTREQTTTYDAVLYYGDRLTEDHSNIDSVHSDAATVIQTIVGALNQSDDEYISVEYPVPITLFEQSFSDDLAGGYANLIIHVEGMGECFNGEFDIPQIVGTTAYFTKEEIVNRFPLRNELSAVAYSGSFKDLSDAPEIITSVQYNQLYNKVSEVARTTSILETGKLDVMTFNKWVSDFESGLSGTTPISEFRAFVQGQNTINMNLAVELKNSVKSQYLDSQVSMLKTLIDSKVSTQAFDNTILGVNQVVVNLAGELSEKLDKDYFDGWKDGLVNLINAKVSTQAFDTVMSNIYTKSEVDNLIVNKVDKVFDSYVKSDAIEGIVNGLITDAIDNIVEDVTESVRVEIDSIVSDELQNQLNEYVTVDDLDVAVEEKYHEYVGSDDFNDSLQTVVDTAVREVIGDVVTIDELNAKNYVTKYYVDKAVEDITVDITGYATEEYVSQNYVPNTEFTGKYYTKSEIDSIIDNIEITHPSVDLSNYYNKSEVDTLIQTKLGAIDDILNNILYTK